MSHRAETVELVALVVTGSKCHFDAVVADIATREAEARVGVWPPRGQLRRVAGSLRANHANAVNHLHRPAGVNVAAEKDLDAGRLQQFPQPLAMWRIDRKTPIVVVCCSYSAAKAASGGW